MAVRKAVVRTDANDVPNAVGDCGRPIQKAERLALIDSVAAKGGRPRGPEESFSARYRGPGLQGAVRRVRKALEIAAAASTALKSGSKSWGRHYFSHARISACLATAD